MGGVVSEGRRTRENVEQDESNVERNGRVRVLVGGVQWGDAHGEGNVSDEAGGGGGGVGS